MLLIINFLEMLLLDQVWCFRKDSYSVSDLTVTQLFFSTQNFSSALNIPSDIHDNQVRIRFIDTFLKFQANYQVQGKMNRKN